MRQGRQILWVGVALAAGTLLVLAIVLAAQSIGLSHGKALSPSEHAAVTQALAAAGGLAGTAALVGVTAYYARVTAKMLERGGPSSSFS